MATKDSKRNNSIYLLSTICALLIVLRHSSNLYKTGPYLVSMNIDDNLLGKLCMGTQAFVHGGLSNIALYAFFVMSGYLFFRGFVLTKYLDKLKSRFFSIFIPYILWHTISYVIMLVLTNVPFLKGRINTNPYSLNIKDYIYSLFFPDDIYWYLNYLIVFYLLVPIVHFVTNNKCGGGLVILLMLPWCEKGLFFL